MRHRWNVALVATALLVCGSGLLAFDLESFEKNLTEHRLDNGLTVLIYERPTAPVVSFFTYVDVGGAQEVPGITGIAHMFEHMAFKGTSRIGTNDIAAERKAIARIDEAYAAYDRERRKRGGPDEARLAELKAAMERAQAEADKYIVKNEFDEILSRAGGVGLNAGTGSDSTSYFFSLPSNKVELWAYLESERFLDPVFREFYKERDVVQEERRLRTESNPIGRMIEQAMSAAFTAHPYRQPVVGYMSDLQSFTRQDAQDFYKKHYVPANMVIAIVGDVKAGAVIPIVDSYFGRMKAGPKPEPLRTVEPQQMAERILRIPDDAQPVYAEAYHKPSGLHPDDAIYQVMSDILSSGRVSRLYRRLVRDEKVAAQAAAFAGFPGQKYPNLMIFFAIPTPDHTTREIQALIREEIAKLQTEPVSDEELARAKTRAKAGLIRGLQSNTGIAGQLAGTQAVWGDWREIFRSVERIDRVTAEDIRRVANEIFKPTNRTVVFMGNEAQDDEGESR